MPTSTLCWCKDSDYLLNLQKEIEKSEIFDQIFGHVGKCGYLCTLNFFLNLYKSY